MKRKTVTCLKLIAGIVCLGMMSVFFIFGYDFLTQCDHFIATTINVEGGHRVSAEQIICQSQIGKGRNILSINLPLTRIRLLAHPWIAEAEVRRELPDKIAIKIREHTPLAILNLGRNFLINTDGEIFKEIDSADPVNLPIISGLDYSDLDSPKKQRSAAFAAVMDVLRMGSQSENKIPYLKIKRINVDRELGLTLYASDLIRSIKLGYDDFPNKYNQLKNILFYLDKNNSLTDIDLIDLKQPKRIVIRPSGIESFDGNQKEV